METNKTYEQIFKNHVAELKVLDDDTQVLSFKDPNSKYYGAEFLFRKNSIFINGDTGWAVFNMTFCPTWDYSWEAMDTGYFSEKCKAFSDDKYVRSNEAAEKTIKEHIIDMFKDNKSTDGEEVADYIIWLARQKPFWKEIENDDVFNEDNEDQFLKFAVLLLRTFYISENQEQYIHLAIFGDDMKGFRDLRREVDFSRLGEELNSKFELWLYMLVKAKEQLRQKFKEEGKI